MEEILVTLSYPIILSIQTLGIVPTILFFVVAILSLVFIRRKRFDVSTDLHMEYMGNIVDAKYVTTGNETETEIKTDRHIFSIKGKPTLRKGDQVFKNFIKGNRSFIYFDSGIQMYELSSDNTDDPFLSEKEREKLLEKRNSK